MLFPAVDSTLVVAMFESSPEVHTSAKLGIDDRDARPSDLGQDRTPMTRLPKWTQV